jgi:hypothetical protein
VPLDLLPLLMASVPVTVVPGADMALVAQPLTKAINKEHGHIHQFSRMPN